MDEPQVVVAVVVAEVVAVAAAAVVADLAVETGGTAYEAVGSVDTAAVVAEMEPTPEN